MSLTTDEIRDYVVDHIEGFTRFINFERLPKVVSQIQTYGLGVMSRTLIARAIQDLKLTPLWAEEDDAADSVIEAQRQADAVPLTRELGNELTRLSPRQVAEKFYSDAYFQRLYTRAAEMWGFKIPAKPASSSSPSVTPIELDARTFHSTPTQTIIRRYRSEPAFKAAVDKLVAEGKI